MSAPLTILCAGAYGIRNAGDDLPLLTLADGMRRLLPGRNLRFRALSRHPDPWETETYGVTMVPNLEHSSAAAARDRWFLGLNPDDDPAPFENVRREIHDCDLLVLGAGNALLDHTIGLLRGPVPLMAQYGSLARLYDRPVMLYGLSVGPLRTGWGRDLSRRLIADAAVVTVRDQESLDTCRDLLKTPREIHLLPDATMAAAPPAADHGHKVLRSELLELPNDRPVVALGLRDLHRPLGDQIGDRQESALLELIERWSDCATFLFVAQSTYSEDDDRMFAARLAGRAPAGSRCLVVKGRHHPRDLVALYGLAQVTVASRLHAAVFSAMAGTPVVGIDYLPKVRGFLEQVDGCGTCVGLDELDADAVAHAAARLLDGGEELRERLQARVAEMRTRAEGHARLAVTSGLGLDSAEASA